MFGTITMTIKVGVLKIVMILNNWLLCYYDNCSRNLIAIYIYTIAVMCNNVPFLQCQLIRYSAVFVGPYVAC